MFNLMFKMTFRGSLLLYGVFFLTLIWPYWISGDVITPHLQFLDLKIEDQIVAKQIENYYFSDFVLNYIPKITEHFNAPRSSFLALWTNRTELGLPLNHLSGFSSAYLPTWIISSWVDDPWSLITTLSLGMCFLAGFFILLFAREVGLSPLSGLISGLGMAASPFFMFWLTFPMFITVGCWAAGSLWAVTRLAKCPDILGWSVLAFSGYSLLITGYPQAVVIHAYLLSGYWLWLARSQVRTSQLALVKFLMLTVSALIVGAGLSYPIYRDLYITYTESARFSPDISWFIARLPNLTNFSELVRFFVLSTAPEIFGNPINRGSYPLPYDGYKVISSSFIVIFFAIFALFTIFKKTWGWWLAILILYLLSLVHPLYELAIKYFGFNLSRSSPLACALLPLTIITAFGIDVLVKRTYNYQFAKAVFAVGSIMLIVIVIGVAFGISQNIPIHWGSVVGLLILLLLLIAQYDRTRPKFLILALGIVLIMTSYPLMLKQDPLKIAMSSPLTERIKSNLQQGSRYAIIAPGDKSMLRPNLNVTLGLSSIHSYNSLSSHRYHTLIKSLGGKVYSYGRHNRAISPDYAGTMFWISNVGLILSPKILDHQNLEPLGEESGIHFYRVVSRMGESLQVVPPQLDMNMKKIVLNDPRDMVTNTPIKILDQGDVLEFKVEPTAPSVLLVSQKFNRDWEAITETDYGWQAAQTVEVNGVFQGVILPQDTHRVRLNFKPLARYAWIANVFWALLLVLIIVLKSWQRYQRKIKKV